MAKMTLKMAKMRAKTANKKKSLNHPWKLTYTLAAEFRPWFVFFAPLWAKTLIFEARRAARKSNQKRRFSKTTVLHGRGRFFRDVVVVTERKRSRTNPLRHGAGVYACMHGGLFAVVFEGLRKARGMRRVGGRGGAPLSSTDNVLRQADK